MSPGWLQPGRRAFGLMLRLRCLLLPGVPGLVAAIAVEATRRLAALLAEEGGVQFPAALRAAGEADSGHGPSLLRHLGKDCRGPASNYGSSYLSPPAKKIATFLPHPGPSDLPDLHSCNPASSFISSCGSTGLTRW